METYYTVVKWVLTSVFGLCVGSFLNVVIYRVPEGMSIASPKSHCPKCGYKLKPYDNIPVISYMILGGKCRSCRERISPRYMLVELANMFLWMGCLLFFGKTSLVYTYVAAVALSVCVCIFFIDLDTMLIYDRFQIMFALLGGFAAFLDNYEGFLAHILAGIAAGLIFLLLALAFKKVTGKDALGGGDIKLVACMGVFLGWKKLLLAILVSSFVASIVLVVLRRINGYEKGKEYPFGPFLTSGFAFSLFFGERIIDAYISLLI